jgi:predicted house-cleaning NTP pyrophosphatase (Maf/HAM1 superfamily)
MHRLQLILTSGFLRRRQLLAEADYGFEVVAPIVEVDCDVCSEYGRAGLVTDFASRYAAVVWQQLGRHGQE